MRRRSWVDAFADAVDRSPVPGWVLFLAAAAVAAAGSVVLRVVDGTPISPITTAFAAATPLPLAAVVYTRGAARAALSQFRPAMGELDAGYADYERRLVSTGTATSIAALAFGVVVVVVGQLMAAGGWGITGATSPATNVFTIVCQTILNVGFALFVLRAITQTRVIAELHRTATAVRLWDARPHVAFARLTLVMAVIVTVPYAVLEVFAMALDESSVVEVAIFSVAIVVAVVIFVVPLLGMRRRLVAEKSRRLAESDRAFEEVSARLHAAIDVDDLERAGAVHDALDALVVEQDRLRRISTWPWSVETLRGFISSVGIPILLWVITAVLDRFVA